MAQLSLYLDDCALAALKEGARREGISMSRSAAESIVERDSFGWPMGFFDSYGSVSDDTFAAPSDADSGLDEAELLA